jgi:hypothetical protein
MLRMPPLFTRPRLLGALLVVAAPVAVGGCAASAPSLDRPLAPPGTPPPGFTRPHWDQVCRDDRGPRLFGRVDEVMDPRDVEGHLEALAVPEWEGGGDGEAPFVDVAVSFHRSGAVRAAYLLRSNVEEVVAIEVAGRVAEAVRPTGRLLEPVDLRVRVGGLPEPGLALLPARVCLPHITHEEDRPPPLPRGIRLVGAHFLGDPGGERITVRLHVSERGVLEQVEAVSGDEDLLPRVREALGEVEFDPALRNGMPVAGTLVLVLLLPRDRS